MTRFLSAAASRATTGVVISFGRVQRTLFRVRTTGALIIRRFTGGQLVRKIVGHFG